MSSSSPSSGHDDFLSPVKSNQTQTAFSGTQVPSANSPLQSSTTMGMGSQTPSRPSVSPPQSFSPSTTSWSQSPPQVTTNAPQTPPVAASTLPQTSPQPSTNWSQPPSQPAVGWPQTPPQPSTGWPQTPSPVSSVTQSQGLSSTTLQTTSQQYHPPSHQVQSGTPPIVTPSVTVEPVQPHWFFMKGNSAWLPFSFIDSDCLEQALKTPSTSGDRIVPTDGGRYDVNLDKRLRYPLYWEEGVSVVRRCTWFYKGDGESKLRPYMEDMAARLEV